MSNDKEIVEWTIEGRNYSFDPDGNYIKVNSVIDDQQQEWLFKVDPLSDITIEIKDGGKIVNFDRVDQSDPFDFKYESSAYEMMEKLKEIARDTYLGKIDESKAIDIESSDSRRIRLIKNKKYGDEYRFYILFITEYTMMIMDDTIEGSWNTKTDQLKIWSSKDGRLANRNASFWDEIGYTCSLNNPNKNDDCFRVEFNEFAALSFRSEDKANDLTECLNIIQKYQQDRENEAENLENEKISLEEFVGDQSEQFRINVDNIHSINNQIRELARLRKSIGLPRRVVAKRMGVKKSVVKGIESLCIDPTLTVFNSYVDAIGLSLTITTKVIEESSAEKPTEREWKTFPTFRDCIDYTRMQENMKLIDENGRTLSYLEAFEQEGGGVSRPKNVHEHVVTGYYWRIITTDEKLNDIEYNILWNLDDFDLEVEICNLDSGMVLTDNLYSNICIDPSKVKLNIQQDGSGIVSWDIIVPDERYWRETAKHIKFKKYDDAVRFHKMLWLAMNVELEHEKQAKSNKETWEGF